MVPKAGKNQTEGETSEVIERGKPSVEEMGSEVEKHMCVEVSELSS